MSPNLVAILYLISALLFIFALRGLSHPESARLGNIFGIIGMFIAICITIYAGLDTIDLYKILIGAMIGTEDLGQYILKALSDLKGGGKGLILGLCVAFIGLAVDNLIRTWAEKRKKLLGIS